MACRPAQPGAVVRWAQRRSSRQPNGWLRRDWIIADYNLPNGLNGLETIARLQRAGSARNPSHHLLLIKPYSIMRLATYFIPKCMSCSISSG